MACAASRSFRNTRDNHARHYDARLAIHFPFSERIYCSCNLATNDIVKPTWRQSAFSADMRTTIAGLARIDLSTAANRFDADVLSLVSLSCENKFQFMQKAPPECLICSSGKYKQPVHQDA